MTWARTARRAVLVAAAVTGVGAPLSATAARALPSERATAASCVTVTIDRGLNGLTLQPKHSAVTEGGCVDFVNDDGLLQVTVEVGPPGQTWAAPIAAQGSATYSADQVGGHSVTASDTVGTAHGTLRVAARSSGSPSPSTSPSASPSRSPTPRPTQSTAHPSPSASSRTSDPDSAGRGSSRPPHSRRSGRRSGSSGGGGAGIPPPVLPPATPELSARAEPSRSPALAPSSPTPMNPDSTAPAASPSASPTPRAAAEVHAAGHRALLGLAGGLALLQLGALLVGRRRTVDGRRRGVGGPA